MKKLLNKLISVWNIGELRNKIVLTIILILVYRVGTQITLPGINPNLLTSSRNGSTKNSLLNLFDTFAGGAFSKASVLALGIMPYISASIFMQLMTILIPQLQKIQKEGESGRRQLNQLTRYLTIIVTMLQAGAYIAYLKSPGYSEALIPSYQSFFAFSTVVILSAGTLFVMWLGEKIQDRGMGNGTSIIIMVGILARLPQSIVQEFAAKSQKGGAGGLLIFLIELALLVFIIIGLVILVQGTRKIPVNYAKQIIGNRQIEEGGARQFLPVKFNSAGVMPIIFAQAVMFLPTLVSFTNIDSSKGFVKVFSDHSNFLYMLIYSVLVIGFTFLYTALIFNPKQVADDLKRNNGFVPGIKPGEPTADYIGSIMDKITLPSAFFLAFVGIMPGFAQRLGVTQSLSTFFGGTSLLIMVGVILDTLQQIDTYLLMRDYDGIMSTTRVPLRNQSSISESKNSIPI